MINWLKTNNRWQAILGLLMLVGAFAAGRWLSPEKVVTRTVTVEVEKTKSKQDSTTIKVTKPDGTITETTTTKTETETVTNTNNKTETIVQNKKSALNVNALAGINVTNPAGGIIFGGHISKQIFGPVSIGVFGLSNGTAGLSVGLQF